ncbi:phage baseplate protein [Kitasatospora sp. NPDC004240]
MINNSFPTTSRRSLLAWGGAAALAAGSGLAAGAGPAAAAPVDPPGKALLVPSARVDVGADSVRQYLGKELTDATVLQCFAYDNVNGHVYLAQVTGGNWVLEGDPGPLTAEERARRGDLTVTRWTTAGEASGFMHLRGFGHGVALGVEVTGKEVHLWVEAASVANSKGIGFGTRIARVRFVHDSVVTSSTIPVHDPVPGSLYNAVAVDPVYDRLVHRYQLDGRFRYRVHDLALARLGVWTAPLAEIEEPAVVAPVIDAAYGSPSFQGFTAAGRYLYMLHGDPYGTTEPSNGGTLVVSRPGTGNTFVSAVDLLTGQLVKTSMSRAAIDLEYREPEGIAIRLPDPANPAVFELAFGFASGPAGARVATVYLKKDLLPPPV